MPQHLMWNGRIITQSLVYMVTAMLSLIRLANTRSQNQSVNTKERILNHEKTYQQAFAERNVLKILEGDCETAVGAHATIKDDEITLEAELFSLDGTQRFYEKKSAKIENAKELGKEVGQILKTKSNNSYKR